MLDPGARWGATGRPDYAGLLTYAGMPYTEDPAEVEGADVAIVGAPFDDLVSDRPGTRYGPRAIRDASLGSGTHLEAKVNPFTELRVVDFGDAPVVPADARRSHQAIEDLVGIVARAGALPLVLGGDHSIAEPDMRACAAVHGRLGLVQLDTHTDTATEVFGVEFSHGTPMRTLVDTGLVDPKRYVQIGLRGYWPEPEEFAWQHDNGIGSFFMHDVRMLGVAEVVQRTVAQVGDGPTFLSVDIDAVDPAFAPGTGTPEPGGMTSAEVLEICRLLGERLHLVGADLVEVAPITFGTADITALLADRIVREILTGIALRRRPSATSG
jgi:agmatinase